jgi:hypothetical protein
VYVRHALILDLTETNQVKFFYEEVYKGLCYLSFPVLDPVGQLWILIKKNNSNFYGYSSVFFSGFDSLISYHIYIYIYIFIQCCGVISVVKFCRID